MFSKKAFSMQFSWIFVLMVGFAIIIFVISSISKQRDISETNVNIEVVKNINSIFTSAEKSTGAFKIIKTPEMSLELRTDPQELFYFINNKQTSIGNTLLFAPKKISGNQMFTWSKSYNMPMKITNMLYITNKKVKYIFVNGSSTLVQQTLNFVPKNLTIDYLDTKSQIPNLVYDNFDYYVIVAKKQASLPPSTNALSFAKKTSLLLLDSDIGVYDRGDIEFYELKRNLVGTSTYWESTGNSSFLNQEMLAGAVFSGDFLIYNHTINKLFDKSIPIYEIYNYSAHIINSSTDKYVCVNTPSAYPKALDSLVSLINAAKTKDSDLIRENSGRLFLANKKIRSYGCPLIY